MSSIAFRAVARALCGIALLAASASASAAEPAGTIDVTDLDLDQLLEVRVTSPGKKEQPLLEVPAAIYVIRQEDLRRMGVTSLAEALRVVPGMEVARVGSSAWAISARGFNDTLSNKLLVLIDGRSVYSPLHSGVYWDVQDVLLEDVDRIEVIRGPGGSLWGANAINGVVNVITKTADATANGIVALSGGTEERAIAGVRYGFRPSADSAVRAYAKYFDRDASANGIDPGQDSHDAWSMARGGFRADWSSGANDRLTRFTLEGDVYGGSEDERITAPTLTAPFSATIEHEMGVSGGNVLFRSERTKGPGSSVSFQAFYDWTDRTEALFEDRLRTGDLDFQHRLRLGERNDVLWGVGYRRYRSVMNGSFVIGVDPTAHEDDVWSAFVQDEIPLASEHVRLTFGSKFEHNDYSGFEYQPSLRALWLPAAETVVWAAASRAVRTPSIIDVDGRLTPVVFGSDPPVAVSILGNEDFRSEVLLAYEAGCRLRPSSAIFLDVATFYGRYQHLRSGEIGAPFVEAEPPPVHVVVPVNLRNDLHGRNWGAEVNAGLRVMDGWLLQASYSLLQVDVSEEDVNHRSPRNQLGLRSALDLPRGFTVDVTARYVGDLPALGVESYAEADVRLAWQHGPYEVALVGQNLLHASHAEFETVSKRGNLERGFFASLRRRF